MAKLYVLHSPILGYFDVSESGGVVFTADREFAYRFVHPTQADNIVRSLGLADLNLEVIPVDARGE